MQRRRLRFAEVREHQHSGRATFPANRPNCHHWWWCEAWANSFQTCSLLDFRTFFLSGVLCCAQFSHVACAFFTRFTARRALLFPPVFTRIRTISRLRHQRKRSGSNPTAFEGVAWALSAANGTAQLPAKIHNHSLWSEQPILWQDTSKRVKISYLPFVHDCCAQDTDLFTSCFVAVLLPFLEKGAHSFVFLMGNQISVVFKYLLQQNSEQVTA